MKKNLFFIFLFVFSYQLRANFRIDSIANICYYYVSSNAGVEEISANSIVTQINNGHKIHFLKGKYVITGNLVLPVNSTITGDGFQSELIFNQYVNNQILIDKENISIKKLTISADYKTKDNDYIFEIRPGTKHLLIEECYIGNLGGDNILNGVHFAFLIDIRKVYDFAIKNCIIANITNAGNDGGAGKGFCGGIMFSKVDNNEVLPDETSYGKIEGCKFENIYTTAVGDYPIQLEKDADGIRFYNPDGDENIMWNINFKNNIFKSVQKRAFKLQNCSGVQIDGVNIIADRLETRMEAGIRVYDCKNVKIQNVHATGNIQRLLNNAGLTYAFISNISYEIDPAKDNLIDNGCGTILYHPASFSFYENISVRGFTSFITGGASNTKFININAKLRLYSEVTEKKEIINMAECENNIFNDILIHDYNETSNSSWPNIEISNADGTSFKGCDFKCSNNKSENASYFRIEESSNIIFSDIVYSGNERFIDFPNYTDNREENIYFNNIYLTFENIIYLSSYNDYIFKCRNLNNLSLNNIKVDFKVNGYHPTFPILIHHCNFNIQNLAVIYTNTLPEMNDKYGLLVGFESNGSISNIVTNKTNGVEIYNLAENHKVVVSNKVIVPSGFKEVYVHPTCDSTSIVDYVTYHVISGSVCNGVCSY